MKNVQKKVKDMETRMQNLEHKIEVLLGMLTREFADDGDEFEDVTLPDVLRDHANFEIRQDSEFN